MKYFGKTIKGKTRGKISIFFIALLLISVSVHAQSIEVALTFDDLPGAGELPVGTTRKEIALKIIEELKSKKITGVYGFLNGYMLAMIPELSELLKIWVESGHFLGNHTYSHLNLNETFLDHYIQDFEKNESVLHSFLTPQVYKWFRYPYLAEGDTAEKRNLFRLYLNLRGYTVAQTTIDFQDWSWNNAFARCMDNKDTTALSWLKRSYRALAEDRLYFAIEQSNRVFGQPIKHVLLIHFSALNAAFMSELLSLYLQAGVQFISLPEASSDPLYQKNPNSIGFTGTFLSQWMFASQLQYPPKLEIPVESLNRVCQKRK